MSYVHKSHLWKIPSTRECVTIKEQFRADMKSLFVYVTVGQSTQVSCSAFIL
jgi:hypothetical protein